MAKDKITDYSATNASNTDVGGVGVQGTNAISNFDNGLRELMTHLAETNAGTAPLADTFCVADPVDLTKKVRIDAGNVTAEQTRVLTMPDADVTITAAGAAILDDADAAAQRTTLGLGTMATQAASAVAITGGTLNGSLGATTPSTVAATTLTTSSTIVASATTTATRFITTGVGNATNPAVAVATAGALAGLYSSASNVLNFAINTASVGTVTSTGLNAMAIGASTASTVAGTVVSASTTFNLPVYTVAGLPAAGTAGRMAFASNLRVFNGAGTQEGAGVGTGGLVTDNGTAWKIAGTNITAVA